MSKFGTRDMKSLIDRLRLAAANKEQEAVKRDRDLGPWERERVTLLRDAADSLDAAHRYFLSVEAALA